MTAQAEEPAPVEQPPPPADPAAEAAATAAAAAAVAAVLAAGMAAGATVEALGRVLGPLGLSRAAVRAAWRLLSLEGKPRMPRRTGRGEAAARVARDAHTYRALYLINAARRLAGHLRADDPGPAIRAERRYLRGHLAAQKRRAEAAQAADMAAAVSERTAGRAVFVWVYVSEPGTPCVPINGRTCRDLAGTIWSLSSPPDGTLPGMRHHGCKCRAAPLPVVGVYRT